MKNFLTGLFALLLFCSAAPPSAFAANNIKMVTYFPVPYASYNDLGVTGTCDIGLLDNCALDSGPSLKVFKRTGDAGPLNTGTLTVKGGSLDLQSSALNSKISGTSLTAGQNGTIGTGTLEFKHDLEVNTMPSLIQSIEATNKAVLEKLTLFNESFPGCDAKDNEISWKRLTINDKSGVFLVCGEGEKSCQDEMGQWVTASSSEADTCDGNRTSAFSCAGTAKECVDIKSVASLSYSFSAGAATSITKDVYQNTADTCDGDKNTMALSCHSAGNCVDLYVQSTPSTASCKCGGTGGLNQGLVDQTGGGGLQGGNLGFINCMTCPLGATSASYCDGSPRMPCCLDGQMISCPTVSYYKRSGTCQRVFGSSYQKRTVKCCGSQGGGEPPAQPTCSDQSYKVANKQECCPSAPKTDTDCWKYEWKYTRSERMGGNPPCNSYNGCSSACSASSEGKECIRSTGNYICGQEGCEENYSTCEYDDSYYTCTSSKNGW